MPDYVYALHDFAPENPDEVSFKVGDRIEVVEKDELYGDGWWHVSTHSDIDDDEGLGHLVRWESVSLPRTLTTLCQYNRLREGRPHSQKRGVECLYCAITARHGTGL